MSDQPLQTLRHLERTLELITFLDESAAERQADRGLQLSRALLRGKALFEVTGDRPVVVVVSGGTNVGKSTVFNQLAGFDISQVSPLARGTKCPVVWGDESSLRAFIQEPFADDVEVMWVEGTAGGDETDVPTMCLVSADTGPPGGLVLIDSPDLDSDHHDNRQWAERLLIMSDALVFVVTPEKYNDGVVVAFLSQAVSLRKSLAVVFNKVERDESVGDFVTNILTPLTTDAPVFRLYHSGDDQARPFMASDLARRLSMWGTVRREIKRRSVDGALSELAKRVHEIARLSLEEQARISALHDSLREAVTRAAESYREQLEGERFEELDLVFKRLLADLRIPVIDDFYGALRAAGSTVWSRIGIVVGARSQKNTQRERRRFEERQRFLETSRACRNEMRRVFETPTGFSAELTARWMNRVPPSPTEDDFDGYLSDVEGAVLAWIRDETEAISKRLGTTPGFRTFLVGAKALLQVGSGVAGAILTGGLHASDLAVVPAIERMVAFLVERGLGYAYFAQCRSRLLAVRAAVMSSFLEARLLQPLEHALPQSRQESARHLVELADSLPTADEIIG